MRSLGNGVARLNYKYFAIRFFLSFVLIFFSGIVLGVVSCLCYLEYNPMYVTKEELKEESNLGEVEMKYIQGRLGQLEKDVANMRHEFMPLIFQLQYNVRDIDERIQKPGQ
jgi:hypothetical protein